MKLYNEIEQQPLPRPPWPHDQEPTIPGNPWRSVGDGNIRIRDVPRKPSIAPTQSWVRTDGQVIIERFELDKGRVEYYCSFLRMGGSPGLGKSMIPADWTPFSGQPDRTFTMAQAQAASIRPMLMETVNG